MFLAKKETSVVERLHEVVLGELLPLGHVEFALFSEFLLHVDQPVHEDLQGETGRRLDLASHVYLGA